GNLDWKCIRPQIGFSLASQASVWVSTALWECAPLLIGIKLGPAPLVYYHLGRKLPVMLATMAWASAFVTFPAASQCERSGELPHAREVLTTGTRWVMVTTIPTCVEAWILAPALLHGWLGQVPRDTLATFRALTLATAFAALGEVPENVLWGW